MKAVHAEIERLAVHAHDFPVLEAEREPAAAVRHAVDLHQRHDVDVAREQEVFTPHEITEAPPPAVGPGPRHRAEAGLVVEHAGNPAMRAQAIPDADAPAVVADPEPVDLVVLA